MVLVSGSPRFFSYEDLNIFSSWNVTLDTCGCWLLNSRRWLLAKLHIDSESHILSPLVTMLTMPICRHRH